MRTPADKEAADIPALQLPLDHLFHTTGADVLYHGKPLLGLPGSIDPRSRHVFRALPDGPMATLWERIDKHCYGGIADLTVVRSPRWRDAGRMLVVVHDVSRLGRFRLCTIPWWSDQECEVWTSQQQAWGNHAAPRY